MVADDPDNKIELKTFCSEIINDHKALKRKQEKHLQLPQVSSVSGQAVVDSYLQIKKDVAGIIEAGIEMMMNTPEMEGLIVKK